MEGKGGEIGVRGFVLSHEGVGLALFSKGLKANDDQTGRDFAPFVLLLLQDHLVVKMECLGNITCFENLF